MTVADASVYQVNKRRPDPFWTRREAFSEQHFDIGLVVVDEI
jgi:hypothetical protein